ncbi:coiled-coil domain-containing protein 55-domain containing protein, partial [Usnea florida]
SKLSYGLNITKKPPLGQRPPPAKRKTIFDDDSGPEDGADDTDSAKPISTLGGLQPSSVKSAEPAPIVPPSRLSKPPKISQYGDLSTNHSTNKHSKTAQELDPNIYDYDAVYDSLHAKPSSSDSTADLEKKPKYMSNLLAAAEVRKRDQLRAKEKMLAKERELEGDEFADKEKFVTGAYKRQQEEMKRLEEEEVRKEKEAEERKRREGGGMKALYKNLLERDEIKHKEIMKAVEEGRGKEEQADGQKGGKKEKSEAELAKEKGAIINEEGQVVDKRQLLSAGLNAASAPKPKVPPDPRSRGSGPGG